MTNTLPLHSLKGKSVAKCTPRKVSPKTAQLARWIIAGAVALCLTLTACERKPSYGDEIGTLQSKLVSLTVTMQAMNLQQQQLNKQHDSLFLSYRMLYKQYVRLDSLAFAHASDSSTVAAIKVRQAQITAQLGALVDNMQNLGNLFRDVQAIVSVLDDEINAIKAQLAALPIYDTVRVQQFVGDGNLMLQGPNIQPGETLNFKVDSALFKIWQGGSSVKPISMKP